MTTKISFLVFLLETIERDISELKKYSQEIISDRTYTYKLKKTVQEEIDKLEDQKSRILSIEVEIPEENNDLFEKEFAKIKDVLKSKEHEKKMERVSSANSDKNDLYNEIDKVKLKKAYRY